MRRNITFLVITLVLVGGTFLATLASGNTPVLGLDLQGGVSVVLSPVGKYKPEALDVAVDIIRTRVDGLGVAEPEISRQGNDIVVDLPGVKDRAKAERLVGQTAELRFRPVIAAGLPSEADQARAATTTTTPPTTVAGGTTTTTAPPATDAEAAAAVAACDDTKVGALTTIPTTTRLADQRNVCVVLPDKPGGKAAPRYYLGKAGLTGQRGQQGQGPVPVRAGVDGHHGPHGLRQLEVGHAGPGAVPQAGGDRARRPGAVGAPDPTQRRGLHVVRGDRARSPATSPAVRRPTWPS